MDTSTATRTSPPPSRPAGVARWRLGRGLHRAVLVIHIVSVGAWIGIEVVLGTLVLTAVLTDSAATAGVAFQAIGLFAVWPMLAAGLVCLASGLLLGLGTKWGLVRYWWVAVKLVLNVILSVLVVVALRPGVAEVVEHGRALAAGLPTDADVSDIYFPPVVSLLALGTATVLSVFKPWGRTRAGRHRGARP